MDMQNREELIWKYLDGLCTEAEVNTVELQIKSDPIFAQEFDHLKMLDQSINESVLQTAPEHLTNSILAKVNQPANHEHATFKFVPMMVFLLILLITTVYLTIGSTTAQPTRIPFDWSILELNFNLSQKYLPYIIASFAASALIWMDVFYSRRVAVWQSKP